MKMVLLRCDPLWNVSPHGRKEENWDDDKALGEETEDDTTELGSKSTGL